MKQINQLPPVHMNYTQPFPPPPNNDFLQQPEFVNPYEDPSAGSKPVKQMLKEQQTYITTLNPQHPGNKDLVRAKFAIPVSDPKFQ